MRRQNVDVRNSPHMCRGPRVQCIWLARVRGVGGVCWDIEGVRAGVESVRTGVEIFESVRASGQA